MVRENAEKLRLGFHRQLGDLVEEHGSTFGGIEEATMIANCAREGASPVAEQFALQEPRRTRRAVLCDERTARAGRSELRSSVAENSRQEQGGMMIGVIATASLSLLGALGGDTRPSDVPADTHALEAPAVMRSSEVPAAALESSAPATNCICAEEWVERRYCPYE